MHNTDAGGFAFHADFNPTRLSFVSRSIASWALPRRKKMIRLLRILFVLVCVLVVAVFYAQKGADCSKVDAANSCSNNYKSETNQDELAKAVPVGTVVHLAVVACEDRLQETLMMLKSAVTLSRTPLTAHVFADASLRPKFEQSLSAWKDTISWLSFDFKVYEVTFPHGNAHIWKKLFKPCACQRLFIPDLLTDVDSLIYVDTDVLFLTAPERLWAHFQRFNASHISALAPESEDRQTNWYVRFALHPFFEPLGVNSGVMLMNLTRMRRFDWGDLLWPLYETYSKNITWGDQDIINIIFHDHPDKLYVYGCEWNFRPDHCMYMSTCKRAEDDGAFMLHGSRGFFHKDKQPAFKVTYEHFKKFQLGSDLLTNLVEPLERALVALQSETNTNCAKVGPIFTQQLRRHAQQMREQTAKSEHLA